MTSLNVFMSRGFMSRGLRSGAVVFAAATCLALAGCAGGAPADPGTSSPAPTTSATSDPSPSPTPTPSAVYKPADASGPAQNVPVPVLPEVAKTETKEGLEAFTRHWFERLNYAYQTGDTAAFQDMTSPNCDYCSKLAASLTTNYVDGQWLAGGMITVPAATTTFERAADGNYQVVLQVQQSPITYHTASGEEFRAASKASNTGNVLLADFVDSAWRVNGLHPLR
jgi:hypothetical protein